MHELPGMTATTLRSLLERTTSHLHELHSRYDMLREDSSDEATKTLAGFLAQREVETIAALTRYLERDEDDAALDVHVRLASGFPFERDQEWPARPTPDRLLDIAQHSDDQLDQLCERVALYAAGEHITEALDAIREIVAERRQRLNAAARELGE
jgi:hypothetical protein